MARAASETLPKLQKQFAAQLPEKLESIRAKFLRLDPAAWLPAEAASLHRLLHSLTGSAGTFGMPAVTAAARSLETTLTRLLNTHSVPTTQEWQSFGAELDRLSLLAGTQQQPDAPSLKQPRTTPRLDNSPLIHLVEDDQVQAEHLKQALQKEGYRVQVFTSPAEFRTACTAKDPERPAAIIMDMIFPEGDNAGAEILTELRAQHSRCPPVIFVSVRDDLPSRLAAFRAGASRYLVKPVLTSHLTDMLDNLTGRQPAQPYRVLMVDDDLLLLEAQAEMLRSAGMEVVTLSQPLLVVDLLNQFTPDVAVLDVYMPDASGPEIAAILRERDQQLHLPILFLSAETDMSQQLLALNLGGDDFLVKPVQRDHLVEAVSARARRARQNSTLQRRLASTLYEREREHLALNHHAIVSIADRAGNITYVNEKFCEISGYSQGELMGHNHRLLKSGRHPPEFYRELWSTIASGNVWQGEICNLNKNGKEYWVESTITPFLDGSSDGKPYQYVSIRTDITHVKAAEVVARLNENHLNFILTMSPVVIYTCKAAPGFPATYVSPNIQRLFGYDPVEVLAKTDFWSSGIHPEDAPRIFAGFKTIFDHEAYSHEYRYRMPDGSYRWIHDAMRVIRDDTGKPKEIIGYWADIDARKLSETALQESTTLLNAVIEHLPVMLFLKRASDLRMVMFNKAGEDMLGFSRNDLLNKNNHDSFPKEQADFFTQKDRHVLNVSGFEDIPEEIISTRDGKEIILHTVKVALRDQNGQHQYLLGISEDITKRKAAEMALISAREEADRANRAKSEFLSSMSHELRTPMNAILGFGQLLQYADDLSAEHKDSVGEILNAGDHLLKLINEVLDLSRVESGRIDLSLEAVEVCAVIEESLNLVTTLAAKRNIKISHQGLAGAAVRADRTRLRQALLNLLSNAIKYNREGGTVHITVKQTDADRLRILVADTGRGIPADKLEQLFLPFSRLVEQNSEIEGTGIGLTITRRIVELMGGSVDVESEQCRGSTFWIELPLESMHEITQVTTKQHGAAPEARAVTHEVDRPLYTLLYIEDNPANLRLLSIIIGKRKHTQLLTAHTPELGIELALSRQPDLILLDINLPGMDGFQVLEVLRAVDSHKNTPVIAVTANAMPSDIERGLTAGFSDYLTKPIDIVRLNNLLDTYLLNAQLNPKH